MRRRPGAAIQINVGVDSYFVGVALPSMLNAKNRLWPDVGPLRFGAAKRQLKSLQKSKQFNTRAFARVRCNFYL